MTTFADLMSLLMCFFVLLLAFSEMDVLKFQQLAGSMKYAFGVQHQIELSDIPKGTSIIALEFRPGKPEDTPIETIQQQTMQTTQSSLKFQPGKKDTSGGEDEAGGKSKSTQQDQQQEQTVQTQSQEDVNDETKEKLKQLMTEVNEQIIDGSIEIDTLGQEIIIRINEKGSFAPGSGFLQPRFKPIIRKIATVINQIPGEMTVTGHTDDRKISNEMYRSNWDLSSRRAVAVAHEMIKAKQFDERRLMLKAAASHYPRVPNNSSRNRALNRRVELSIVQGKPLMAAPVSVGR
jgi:chemotaxis protein MotB